jgi:hypothetical protein
MYDIVVLAGNSLKSYTVTDTENRFNGYVLPAGICFYEDCGSYYKPTSNRTEFVIKKVTPKPSIYKRDWYRRTPDKYDYSFTEKTTTTTVREKDVYYNAQRDRFVSKNATSSTKVKTEYGFASNGVPHQIIF